MNGNAGSWCTSARCCFSVSGFGIRGIDVDDEFLAFVGGGEDVVEFVGYLTCFFRRQGQGRFIIAWIPFRLSFRRRAACVPRSPLFESETLSFPVIGGGMSASHVDLLFESETLSFPVVAGGMSHHR